MTDFDPTALGADALAAAVAEAKRRDREDRAALLASLPTMSDDALRAVIADYERESGTDAWECEQSTDPDHGQGESSRCPACAARAILARREHLAQSRRPGEDPHVPISGVQTVASWCADHDEIQPGDVTTHRPRPGLDASEYVVAVSVSRDATCTTVVWQRTNDPDARTITAQYRDDEWLDLSRVIPVKDATR